MSTNKRAVILVVITFLLVVLIYSSVAKFEVFARPPATASNCVNTKPTSGFDTAQRCCYTTTYFDFYGRRTGSDTVCEVCQYGNDGSIDCGMIWHPPISSQPLTNAPPSSLAGKRNGNPITNQFGTNITGNTTKPTLQAAPPATTSGNNNAANLGNNGNAQQQQLQGGSIGNINTGQQQQLQQQPTTAVCPDGSTPDASGNCPSSTTTTNNTNTGSLSMKAIRGVYSPTGYCDRSRTDRCIPCDPGIGSPYCVPSSDWPAGPYCIPGIISSHCTPTTPSKNKLGAAGPPANILSSQSENNGNTGNTGQQQPMQQQPTATLCPDGSQPDANGNCPSSTTTTNNQQLVPPSSTTSTQHHHKGSNLVGGQQLTNKKGSNNNNDNSPTPPPCPTDNSPIPPNCTLKPKF